MARNEVIEKDMGIHPEEQHVLSLTVACPFCHKPAGERCVPGLIFPQYPHTPRLQDALVAKGHAREDVLALWTF